MEVPLAIVYALSEVLEADRVFVPGAVISGFIRPLPSTVAGTAAAKGSNRIGAGVQCPDRVRCRIERWWICHSGTTRSGVTRRDHHHNASSGLSFNGSLQCVNRTAFRRRTAPGVNGNIGCLGRVALARRLPGKAPGKIPCTRCIWPVSRHPRPCCGNRSTLRRAPFQSGSRRRRRRSLCQWCEFHGSSHRKAVANRYRRGYRRCHEWSHASCSCDRRLLHSSRGSEV